MAPGRLTAAIQYHPDGFRPGHLGIMGRQAAGAGFLEGYVRHSAQTRIVASVASSAHGREFQTAVAALDPRIETTWVLPHEGGELARSGTLMLAGPDLSKAAWLRREASSAYSLCGVTHTTASHHALDELCEMLIAPVYPWDALICTSTAVKTMVETVFDEQTSYLTSRLRTLSIPRPALPVIPLGVDADRYSFSDADRREARLSLGISPDEQVVLFVGRLSFHAKAHPFPLFMALQRAAERTGWPVRLVLAGWYANDGQKEVFEIEAAAYAPALRLQHVDGRSPATLRQAWASADIFTLLADNIQETFGLAPIEAMAAGLPVVVSDWDGFRDTVEDGVQGMRIPTLQPPPGAGRALATRYELNLDSYDAYVGAASQSVAVDIAVATDAFTALLGDEALRARMGAAGRRRAREIYDWSVIVRRYQDLWSELGVIRASAGEVDAVPRAARPDPFTTFAGYPTQVLDGDVRLVAGPFPDLAALLATHGAMVRRGFLLDQHGLLRLAQSLSGGAGRVGDLAGGYPLEDRARVLRSLVWMLKFGLAQQERGV